MTMEQGANKLKEIAQTLQKQREGGLAPSSPRPTVREFIRWFGYARRGYWFIERVREELEANGLYTEPDFQHAYVDGSMAFHDATDSTPPGDSTRRVDMLDAAHKCPVSVTPNDTITTAISHMVLNDFSQIPVIEAGPIRTRNHHVGVYRLSEGTRADWGRCSTLHGRG